MKRYRERGLVFLETQRSPAHPSSEIQVRKVIPSPNVVQKENHIRMPFSVVLLLAVLSLLLRLHEFSVKYDDRRAFKRPRSVDQHPSSRAVALRPARRRVTQNFITMKPRTKYRFHSFLKSNLMGQIQILCFVVW